MKVDTHMSGPIHPQSTHMGLLTNSNKDLKTSTFKPGPASFKPTQESLEHTSSLNEFKMEKYLNLPPHLRVPTSRLRTSAHSLRIETGRYNLPTPIPANERFCWFCSNQIVEDELHFLFDCDLYKPMPEKVKLMEHCSSQNQSFAFLSNLDKWKFISFAEQPKIILFLFCKFVATALETRKTTVHAD